MLKAILPFYSAKLYRFLICKAEIQSFNWTDPQQHSTYLHTNFLTESQIDWLQSQCLVVSHAYSFIFPNRCFPSHPSQENWCEFPPPFHLFLFILFSVFSTVQLTFSQYLHLPCLNLHMSVLYNKDVQISWTLSLFIPSRIKLLKLNYVN